MQYKSWRNQSVINYGGALDFLTLFNLHFLRFSIYHFMTLVHNAGGSMTIDSAYVGIGFQPWQVRPLFEMEELSFPHFGAGARPSSSI
jgi:hypothetical protein